MDGKGRGRQGEVVEHPGTAAYCMGEEEEVSHLNGGSTGIVGGSRIEGCLGAWSQMMVDL